MEDHFGRKIDYLRISVTQDCNLRCIYCVPEGLERNEACREGISAEEYTRIVHAMAEEGISKLRFTGGEPLMRRDLDEIIAGCAIPGIKDISITTNGVLLSSWVTKLKDAGLTRINISLDTLSAERYKKITGCDKLQEVLNGVEKAYEAGLDPIRINTVLIKGYNEDEVDHFIDLTRDRPIEVRFIELMPVGHFGEKNQHRIVYNSDLIQKLPYLVKEDTKQQEQPATYYSIDGHKGRIGFISPMGHRFCQYCNRIRLTWDGKIKPCLGDNQEFDIMEALRNHPEMLEEIIRQAILCKPSGHRFMDGFHSDRSMNRIGG